MNTFWIETIRVLGYRVEVFGTKKNWFARCWNNINEYNGLRSDTIEEAVESLEHKLEILYSNGELMS